MKKKLAWKQYENENWGAQGGDTFYHICPHPTAEGWNWSTSCGPEDQHYCLKVDKAKIAAQRHYESQP